jgi:hypothetical protein
MKKTTGMALILVIIALAACSQPQTERTPTPAPESTYTSLPASIPISTPGRTATAKPIDTLVIAPAATTTSVSTAVPTLTEAPLPAKTQIPETSAASRVPYYDIGSPVLYDLWVDPVSGDDSRGGTSRAQALRTIGAAWALIPPTLATTGYEINLLPGDYPCEGDCINFFSDRTGTFSAPIILRAAEGRGTVTLRGGLNLLRVRYLYLNDLTLWAGREAGAAFGNNVLHIEQADHVLLRNLTLRGPMDCITDECNDMQEVLKVNQSQYVYLEDSDLSGAYQTVLDYFAVQHGHIIGNAIHRSGGRGAYVKGGSAYFLIANNEFYDCREAAVQAGEGSNLAFMQSPWLHYESYDVKIVNNVIHDIRGAGLSVAGSYDVLMAYNTLYNVGQDDESGRPWPLLQVIHGSRSCQSADEFGGDAGTRARCQQQLDQGGWGTTTLGEENGGEWIPNRNIYVYNNIFYNPDSGTRYVHFVVNGPITPPGQVRNIPSPSHTDSNLVIKGNIIWNSLQENAGIIGDNNGSGNVGCQANHPTCNDSLLLAQNHINEFRPELVNPGGGDFRPLAAGNVFAARVFPVPDFQWTDAPTAPPVPAGTLSNDTPFDRDGKDRTAAGPPGAYASATPRTFP